MKITRDTPEQLIVENRPWLMGLLLIGFTLVFVGVGIGLLVSGEWMGLIFGLGGGGIGLLAFWAFVRRTQVIFHRGQGYCERRERSLTGMQVVRHRLDEISRAVVEESRSSKGSTTRRTTLVIEQGESAGRHPITKAYDNFNRHRRIAARINDWLAEARGGADATLDSDPPMT